MAFCSGRSYALVALHITILLWGITAILGKLITYGSFLLVWHRMYITFFVYACIPSFWYQVKHLSRSQILIFMGIGIIISFHWICFYGSIKLGDSASITLICAGSLGFFTSILEPLILKQPFSYVNISLGLVVIIGIILVFISLEEQETAVKALTVSNISNNGDSDYNAVVINSDIGFISPQLAVVAGLIATALASLFFVLNKKHVGSASPLVMSAIEMGSGAMFLSILVPCMYREHTLWYPHFDPYHLSLSTIRSGPWDLIWLLILSILCTNVTFYLSNYSLKYVSAFTSNIIFILEPIYGIILGSLIFHENKQFNSLFYIGLCIILASVFISPIIDHYNLHASLSVVVTDILPSSTSVLSKVLPNSIVKASQDTLNDSQNDDDSNSSDDNNDGDLELCLVESGKNYNQLNNVNNQIVESNSHNLDDYDDNDYKSSDSHVTNNKNNQHHQQVYAPLQQHSYDDIDDEGG